MAKRNLPNGSAVPMESGERDRAVLVEKLVESVSDSRVPIESWETLISVVWMRKMDAKAGEQVKGDQVAAAFDTQWEMGYRRDMDPELLDVPKSRRLRYQGRTYLIVGASLIGRREGIELLTIGGTRVGA
jgi:hypothetical protein